MALFLKRTAAALALGLVLQQAGAPSVMAQEAAGTGPTPQTQESETVTDLTLVRANLTAWLAAFNAKDIDALMALYDAESSYASAGAPLITGEADIRERYQGAFAAITGTLLFKEEKAFVEGGMGLLVGQYYFKPPQGAAQTGGTGRVALVYRKQADGSWKLLFDMDNTPPDVTPENFD